MPENIEFYFIFQLIIKMDLNRKEGLYLPSLPAKYHNIITL